MTGQIFTHGGACIVGGAPCSPAGLSAGEVILDLTLVGISGGTEIELGAQTDEFTVVPGGAHTTEVEIQPDAAHTGTTFETIELRTWIHGVSAGHGVIKTNGDMSSFIAVPTAPKAEPPGCKKGKGKKKGRLPTEDHTCP